MINLGCALLLARFRHQGGSLTKVNIEMRLNREPRRKTYAQDRHAKKAAPRALTLGIHSDFSGAIGADEWMAPITKEK